MRRADPGFLYRFRLLGGRLLAQLAEIVPAPAVHGAAGGGTGVRRAGGDEQGGAGNSGDRNRRGPARGGAARSGAELSVGVVAPAVDLTPGDGAGVRAAG